MCSPKLCSMFSEEAADEAVVVWLIAVPGLRRRRLGGMRPSLTNVIAICLPPVDQNGGCYCCPALFPLFPAHADNLANVHATSKSGEKC